MEQDIIEALQDLFEDGSLGLQAQRNDNGADSYRCISCDAEKKVDGYAFGTMPVTFLEHRDDCPLMKIYKKVSVSGEE